MKKFFAVIMAMAMVLSLAACGKQQSGGTEAASGGAAATSDGKSYKVGWSLIDTSDAVIAQTIQLAKEAAAEKHIDLLVSDAGSDASKQIDAVENFIESGCDVIIIQSLDATSMANETAKAHEKGIKVVAYGIGIDGCDVWYKNDNTVTGTAIGKMASDWINEAKGGSANVYIIGFSMLDVLIERATAIENAIKAGSPNATIVGSFDAIDAETGMSNTESVLAAHPEVDVICSISDGPAVGAYEAVKAAGRDNDDFGVFGSDLSLVAVDLINKGTCYRGTTDVDSLASGEICIDIAYKLVTGEAVDDVVVMGCTPVTAANVSDYTSLLQ